MRLSLTPRRSIISCLKYTSTPTNWTYIGSPSTNCPKSPMSWTIPSRGATISSPWAATALLSRTPKNPQDRNAPQPNPQTPSACNKARSSNPCQRHAYPSRSGSVDMFLIVFLLVYSKIVIDGFGGEGGTWGYFWREDQKLLLLIFLFKWKLKLKLMRWYKWL